MLMVVDIRAIDLEERWVRLRFGDDVKDVEILEWAKRIGQLVQIPRFVPPTDQFTPPAPKVGT